MMYTYSLLNEDQSHEEPASFPCSGNGPSWIKCRLQFPSSPRSSVFTPCSGAGRKNIHKLCLSCSNWFFLHAAETLERKNAMVIHTGMWGQHTLFCLLVAVMLHIIPLHLSSRPCSFCSLIWCRRVTLLIFTYSWFTPVGRWLELQYPARTTLSILLCFAILTGSRLENNFRKTTIISFSSLR